VWDTTCPGCAGAGEAQVGGTTALNQTYGWGCESGDAYGSGERKLRLRCVRTLHVYHVAVLLILAHLMASQARASTVVVLATISRTLACGKCIALWATTTPPLLDSVCLVLKLTALCVLAPGHVDTVMHTHTSHSI